MYTTMERIKVGSILFADDNLSPTKIERIEQLDPLLAIYDRYTGVSGLNINIRKSSALCINTPEALVRDFQHRGFTTPENMRHLLTQPNPRRKPWQTSWRINSLNCPR
jgi:hypothetical protein